MKHIAILGSTGSIGTQSLDVVSQHPDELEVAALAAGSNIVLLEQQIRQYRPRLAAVWDEKKAAELNARYKELYGKTQKHSLNFDKPPWNKGGQYYRHPLDASMLKWEELNYEETHNCPLGFMPIVGSF